MMKHVINIIIRFGLFIGTMALGAYVYLHACTWITSSVSVVNGIIVQKYANSYGIPCSSSASEITIDTLTNAELVYELKQIKQLVAARGTYRTSFVASNNQVKQWQEIAKTDASVIDKGWSLISKMAEGQVVTVTVVGDVYASVDFDFLDTSSITINNKQIRVVLDGPHILSTHVDLAVLNTDEEQGFIPWLMRDDTVKKTAFADIDEELIKVACNPSVSVDVSGRTVRPINDIARVSATETINTLMKITHPDYMVDVSFANETCQLPIGMTYNP